MYHNGNFICWRENKSWSLSRKLWMLCWNIWKCSCITFQLRFWISSISFWTDLSAASSVVTLKNMSWTSLRNLKTSSVRNSVNSALCSVLAAFCFERSWQHPKIPLIAHSPVPRAIPYPNNPTEASVIIASGAALSGRLSPEAAPCAVFRKDKV